MGLFSSFKDKIKVASSNNLANPMGDSFKDLEAAKVKTASRDEESEEKLNSLISEAENIFKDYASNPTNNSKKLRESTKLFIDALRIKKNRVEPYFYLSYIAYLNNDLNTAVKYFQIAELISPEYNNLEKLRKYLT